MSFIIKIINFIESKIEFSKLCSDGTKIFNILDNTTELWMAKYIIGEIFSSGGAILYKNHSDQSVTYIGRSFINMCWKNLYLYVFLGSSHGHGK